jgi:hypothetical protein
MPQNTVATNQPFLVGRVDGHFAIRSDVDIAGSPLEKDSIVQRNSGLRIAAKNSPQTWRPQDNR